MKKTFVGFGFGAIQGGLCLYEAYRSGNFSRLVVAEVVPDVVQMIRAAGGRYQVNVARRDRIEHHEISGVEIYNPLDAGDRAQLVAALAEADEIATALPSVDFFDKGSASVANLLSEALARKAKESALPAAVIYTCENHNHAAEVLEKLVREKLPAGEADAWAGKVQFLNTVIGKMSGVVTDPEQIRQDRLAPMAPGSPRAFLVEEFNRILISAIRLPGFRRGIAVFSEKPDLLPFEEAKLYGHNATHALGGYLAHRSGCVFMSDITQHPELVDLLRAAFLEESGRSLIARNKGLDSLFTPEGYRDYVEDLLVRMMNPWLRDRVERIIRDPRRKLGWNDRLVGVMRLALDAGIQPVRFARGARAALALLQQENPGQTPEQILATLWPEADQPAGRKAEIQKLILAASLS